MGFLTKIRTERPEPKSSEHTEKPAPVDAQIRVSIAEGRLAAYISIEPPENGGSPPSPEALRQALSDCGVSCQIDPDKLRALSEHPVYRSDILIAQGIPPVHGTDGTAVYQFSTREKSLKPKETDEGLVDYRELGLVENVSRGQVLCLITPPTEGTPGMSVRGETLPQKKGRPVLVRSYMGQNTELNEDGTTIVSKIDGQVDLIGKKIQVSETFFVKENVDLSTGNIKVVGNLVVNGMVLPGFQIEAGGNISVLGTVEAAVIRAGGNVSLKGGVTGSQLHCEGDLQSRFIENCDVFAKGNVRAEYVLQSFVKCGKTLKTGGTISKIIGGSCLAGQNIEAKIIGSSANVKTLLELGADPVMIERQQALQAVVPKLEKQIESLKPLVTLLRQLEADHRLTAEKQEVLQTVGASYDAAVGQLEDSRAALEGIARSVLSRGFGRIVCTGTIYPGTKITIGNASLTVADALNSASLFYRDGEIVLGAAR